MVQETRILVIDDEPIIREGCERIIKGERWKAQSVDTGEKGIKEISENNYDIVLLDIKMPGMDGLEVLERIKELHSDTTVIVISGYATVDKAVNAMKLGAYDFIPKPFTPDQLRFTLRRVLERKALIKEAERLRHEKEKSLTDMAQERSRVRTVLNCMADGVLVADQENKIVLSNPAAMRFLSPDGSSLIGKNISEFLADTRLMEMISKVTSQADSSRTSISQEIELKERQVSLMAHSSPVVSEDDVIIGSVTVLQDITHLKQMDRMKSDFVAMVAHELRSPLVVLEQNIYVLLAGILGELNEKQKQTLLRLKERSQGLNELIKNLLNLAKIEEGKICQYKEPLNIQPLLQRVAELNSPLAKDKNILLTSHLPENLPPINGDWDNLTTVFNNLITNAIRYTEKSGTVEISAIAIGDDVKITVADTGIGIPEEEIPKIFDRFYQVRRGQIKKADGSGLGLSIVKAIVDAHLGRIQVASQVGKGTNFHIFLPAIR